MNNNDPLSLVLKLVELFPQKNWFNYFPKKNLVELTIIVYECIYKYIFLLVILIVKSIFWIINLIFGNQNNNIYLFQNHIFIVKYKIVVLIYVIAISE